MPLKRLLKKKLKKRNMNRNEENNKIRSILTEYSWCLLNELRNCPSVVRIGMDVNQTCGLGDSEKTFSFAIRMPKKEVVIRESPTPKEHPDAAELKEGQEISMFGKRLRYVLDDGKEAGCLKCFFNKTNISGHCDASYCENPPCLTENNKQPGHFEEVENNLNDNNNGREEFDPDCDAHG